MTMSHDAVTKIDKIERRTGNFTPMQVLTILVVVGGIIVGFFDRNTDNSKQLNAIMVRLIGVTDSVKMLRLEVIGRMDIHHAENQDRFKNIEDEQRRIETRLSGVEGRKTVFVTEYKRTPNSKPAFVRVP